MRQPYQDELLDRHLKTYLRNVEPAALDEMRACLEWLEVPGGHTLMTQGEAGDAMYLVLSGRLRSYVNDEDGTPQFGREMGRGQIVGEMSLVTGQPRRATVVTIRDCVLVRLGKAQFNRLLATSPQLSTVIMRQIIEHLRARPGTRARVATRHHRRGSRLGRRGRARICGQARSASRANSAGCASSMRRRSTRTSRQSVSRTAMATRSSAEPARGAAPERDRGRA